jgi:hypothetical protein
MIRRVFVGPIVFGALLLPLTACSSVVSDDTDVEPAEQALSDGGSSAIEDADAGGSCGPQDARGDDLCRALVGVAWDGEKCVELWGCECLGADCAQATADGCAALASTCASVDAGAPDQVAESDAEAPDPGGDADGG